MGQNPSLPRPAPISPALVRGDCGAMCMCPGRSLQIMRRYVLCARWLCAYSSAAVSAKPEQPLTSTSLRRLGGLLRGVQYVATDISRHARCVQRRKTGILRCCLGGYLHRLLSTCWTCIRASTALSHSCRGKRPQTKCSRRRVRVWRVGLGPPSWPQIFADVNALV